MDVMGRREYSVFERASVVHSNVDKGYPEGLLTMHGEWFFTIVLFFQIWSTIDCIKSAHVQGGRKAIWLVLIWAVPFGVIVYWLLGRGQKFTSSSPQNRAVNTVYYYPSQQQPEQRSYGEGYQAARPPVERMVQPVVQPVDWQQYEEPMASYPEMPQQQEMRE